MSVAWQALMGVEEGDHVRVRVSDFENTRYPHDDNPRTIEGEVRNVAESVSRAAGEIQRVVVVGDPRDDGVLVDVGDTAENNLTGGHTSRKYTKAWRPRAGKDRLLLGRVTAVEAGRDA